MRIIKNFIVFFVFLTASVVLTVDCYAQFKNDLRRQKLKGNVFEVVEYEYAAVLGSKEPIKGALKVKNVYKYDSLGNRIVYNSYSLEGELLSRSVFNYDSSGTLIDVKRYRGDGGLNVTTSYKYDNAGNEAEEFNTDPTGTLFMTAKSRYDLNGNRLVYDRYNQFGHLFLKSNIKYDRKGNEIQERQYDSHESLQYLTTYEYGNYDKKSNWLSKVTYKNDEPRAIIEREITYLNN